MDFRSFIVFFSICFITSCGCNEDQFGEHLAWIVPVEVTSIQDTMRVGDTIWININIDKDVRVDGSNSTMRLDDLNFFSEFYFSEISDTVIVDFPDLDHNPGEVLMVDFAGSKIAWVDECTGEVHYAQVLVCVMPHSQYTFVIAVDSQCIADFIDAINSAFEYLEGLPKVLLSDNLKSYVTRANRYEPTFTQLCEQMAAHYQIDMQAARVRKPKDKASVENAVTNAYRRVYAPLRHEEFHSLSEINEAFKKQLKTLNERPYQKKSGTRKQIFDTYEKELMSPLPPDLFEIKKLTRAKVQKNYHIILGETNNYFEYY